MLNIQALVHSQIGLQRVLQHPKSLLHLPKSLHPLLEQIHPKKCLNHTIISIFREKLRKFFSFFMVFQQPTRIFSPTENIVKKTIRDFIFFWHLIKMFQSSQKLFFVFKSIEINVVLPDLI